MLACSTQVRGFKPGQSRQIFLGVKIISMPSFGGDVKPSVHLSHVTGLRHVKEPSDYEEV
jgi:hypothetical protein